uniref:Glutaminyl-peptide cyclotransferase n=1 Tax=Craspedostauros australis TaxID=1486917 RepID=A0A7R9WV78_9STRA|mmetsp:Transcript_21638/g.60212  ORF Transcript_21638/g.60212 Transcript_21638/m.60212 type:complete len:413 (+) Transcript_21638:172-1410(+)|eukprot:CAMPEP_0198133620 /NCGR_PEP_ID=MMETSP1442-20131203/59661_1 /TAXON_ID= /ORGANISM="Craspedostauros australis, Strain CCMP3328" /LENGTH=412 /DNA_ID=CAMNT_0043794749 /DNA_START=113 /DNA_END=1351 /DNA_ORIENTATION=-
MDRSYELTPPSPSDEDSDDGFGEVNGQPSTTPQPLRLISSRVRSQNRFFIVAITLMVIAVATYGVTTIYFADETDSLEAYNTETGLLGDDSSHPIVVEDKYSLDGKVDDKYKDLIDKHGKPTSTIDAIESKVNLTQNAQQAAAARWNRTHPGEPMPTPCERIVLRHKNWIHRNISKKDGVKYDIVEQLPHDAGAFTQGVTYYEGKLYESTGLYGESTVRILDAATAKVEKTVAMDEAFFGEGMAFHNGLLYQITWKEKQGFVYNATDLSLVKSFVYTTTKQEGWGITHYGCKDEFIVTDGSNYLHFWDDTTLKQKRKIPVKRLSGRSATKLNEIELWRGRVLANVWFEDVILVIDPETGKVEKEYDFSNLWPRAERKKAKANVLNGISVSEEEDTLYVTGKLWDRIFKIKLR